MRRVAIVGAGLVGAHAAAELTRSGWDVALFDLEPNAGYVARIAGAVSVTRVDALQISRMADLLQRGQFSSVIVAAGVNAVGGTEDEGSLALNEQLPRAVAKAASRAGAERLIHVSSRAVYGAAPCTESAEPRPQTPYGRSKLRGEQAMVEEAFGQLTVCSLRCAGLFGPARFLGGSRSCRLIESLLAAAKLNQEVELEAAEADGDELLYVRDLAQAVRLVLDAPSNVLPPALNVGTGELTGPCELASTIEMVTGWCPTLKPARRIQPALVVPLSIDLARDLLGYRPSYTLASALREMCQSHKAGVP